MRWLRGLIPAVCGVGGSVAWAVEPQKSGVGLGGGLAQPRYSLTTTDGAQIELVGSGFTGAEGSVRMRTRSGWVFEPSVHAWLSRYSTTTPGGGDDGDDGNVDQVATGRSSDYGGLLGAHRRIVEEGAVEGFWLFGVGATWHSSSLDTTGNPEQVEARRTVAVETGVRGQVWLNERLALSSSVWLASVSHTQGSSGEVTKEPTTSTYWRAGASPSAALSLHIFL